LLSLVLAFKKFNGDQKYWVKMEMLGIMGKAKSLVSALVLITFFYMYV
jgi:hypothetical protein